MDDDCVATFHKCLETDWEITDIFRFDAWIINEQDKRIGMHTLNLERESWLEFAYCRLMGWRRSFMQQLVFRRICYEQTGGFLDLPLGWSADDAAVIAMGRQRPIRLIPHARISWRSSGKNITPDRSFERRTNRLRAVCLFLEWLQDQIQTTREHIFENDSAAFLLAMDRDLCEQIMIEGALPSIANWRLLLHRRAGLGKDSRVALLKHILVAAVNDGISAVGKAARKQYSRA